MIVEGKYDKIRLQNVLDAVILTTDGFRIFRDREKLALIRAFAARSGIVILTDSDDAGLLIRRYLTGCIPAAQITQVYLPPLPGKEPRKTRPGAQGLLGVEGIPEAVIAEALARAGLTGTSAPREKPLTKTDFFRLGLTGAPDSRALRQKLLRRLGLPAGLSTNGLLEAANRLFAREEFLSCLTEVCGDGGNEPTAHAAAASDRPAAKEN